MAKLFAKCPLPKVGSADWPWETETKKVLRKVLVPKGMDIPKEIRIESDWYDVPESQHEPLLDGKIPAHTIPAHRECKARFDIERTIPCILTTKKMPGYVIVQSLLDRVDVHWSGEATQQRIETTVNDNWVWDDDSGALSLSKAREWCEQDARCRWVAQNLLTMQECEIGNLKWTKRF